MTETHQSTPLLTPARGPERRPDARAGLFFGLSTYFIWGFIPLYVRALASVTPLAIMCHRIVWSALFLSLTVSLRGEWPAIWPVLRHRRNLLLLSAGAVLIALNWFFFIYAVSVHQLLQASLGYFVNPLLSIALGMLFLRERLRGWQWLAVGLAGLAVLNLALRGSGFPWLAVALAGTFGFYGLVRKKLDMNSLHGLLIEAWLLLPVALGLLWALPWGKVTPLTGGLLCFSGVTTAIPLLCFGAAVRRLTLSTMGFLQYLGPTLQFLVALRLFGEPLDHAKLGSFVLCWAAIVVYAADSLLTRHPQPVADEPE